MALAWATALAAMTATAQNTSELSNPITQAVLGVYADELEKDPNNYEILLLRADEYYRHNDYVRALADVDRAIEAITKPDSPERFRALMLRAGIYSQTNRLKEALADLTAAEEIDGKSPALIYQKANTEYLLGMYSEAKTDFQRLRRLNIRAVEGPIGLARIAVKETNLGTANELLAEAVALDPNNSDIYVRRASVRKQMGDHNGAVEDLILALSADSKNTKALNELVDYGNTNYAATMSGLSSAIAQAPNVGMFVYIRAVIAQAHFNYLAALKDYREILDKKLYNYHGIHASMAECLYCLGDYAEALSEIDYALGITRNDASHFTLLSKILLRLGRIDDAIAAAASALAIDRNTQAACHGLEAMALAYVAKGDYDQASSLANEIVMTDAENPRYYMLKAWIAEKYLGNEKVAKTAYETVAEMTQFYIDNPRSLRGFAQLFLGEERQGEQWMDNILKTVTDNDGLIHYYGACFYAQSGNTERALKCAEEALKKGYANYDDWTELKEGRVNVGPLRDDLRFLNLLHRYNAIFGKK